MDFSNEYKKLIWWLLIATRGGENRFNIISLLKEKPMNINQLSEKLSLNYRTIKHHIKILIDNKIIIKEGEGYGSVYFLAPYYVKNYNIIEEIINNNQSK